MRVNIRFACPGLFDGIPNGIYEIQEYCSILKCVEYCALKHGLSLSEDWQSKVLFFRDNRPVKKDESITEDSDIIVVHRIMGG